jgi:prepilin signal peptidase PulO-like enzyme (type II secretory pathway)
MTIFIFFIFGLIIGSFLNVVICRLNLAESLLGRSHCPKCQKMIRWYDNVPLLSFILLKAECRDCREKISWQYPLVELTIGVIFAAVAWVFLREGALTNWLEVIFYCGFFSALLVIFVFDLKHLEIPMPVIWLALAWTLIFLLILDGLNFQPGMGIFSSRIFSGNLAGLLAFGFFFILAFGSREKWMGMGDAYLALLIGLGIGAEKILPALMLSFLLGSLFGIALIAAKKKTLKSQIPFGPFLASGAVIMILALEFFPALQSWFFIL